MSRMLVDSTGKLIVDSSGYAEVTPEGGAGECDCCASGGCCDDPLNATNCTFNNPSGGLTNVASGSFSIGYNLTDTAPTPDSVDIYEASGTLSGPCFFGSDSGSCPDIISSIGVPISAFTASYTNNGVPYSGTVFPNFSIGAFNCTPGTNPGWGVVLNGYTFSSTDGLIARCIGAHSFSRQDCPVGTCRNLATFQALPGVVSTGTGSVTECGNTSSATVSGTYIVSGTATLTYHFDYSLSWLYPWFRCTPCDALI